MLAEDPFTQSPLVISRCNHSLTCILPSIACLPSALVPSLSFAFIPRTISMIFNLASDNGTITSPKTVLISLRPSTMECRYRLNGCICPVHSLWREQRRLASGTIESHRKCPSPGPLYDSMDPFLPSIHFYYASIMPDLFLSYRRILKG